MARPEIVGELLRRASVTAPDLLAADVASALQDVGGDHLVLYVVDYEQLTLQPVGIATDLMADEPKGVSVEGTLAGRAFQLQQTVTCQTGDGWTVWVPVRERAERIGVLEFGFPEVDEELLRLCDDLGLLVGHLVHTASRYTDLIDLRRRRRPMNLAAEMQWDMLMPP
ncbi:MAG: serine/threonine-protein phosphatase, partial [Actinomycetota bacterium]|nr:serine/threonine-protein phosphatase [Actinomycetota bacterium]